MGNLLASAAAFVLLHRAISGSPLRGAIVERIGEASYGRLFQLASVGTLAWLGMAYAGAEQSYAVTALWNAHPLARDLQLVLQPLALLLIVAGVSTPNPGTFRQEAVADRTDIARGMLRVTRHPFLWGVALFATGHLLAAPSARNLVLFGTLLFVSATGTYSIDAKRRRSLGPKWTDFAAQTSNIPFLAIVQRRQRLRPAEIGWIRLGVAIGASVALALVHRVLFGVAAAA